MNTKTLWLLIMAGLLLAACSPAGNQGVATPEAIPTIVADTGIIAEGRLEPIRYAEIAFTASGVVTDMFVQEGDEVKKGQPLIQLGDKTDANFASARLEVVNAQKALNDLKNSAGTDLAQSVIDLRDAQEEYDDAVDYLDDLQTYDQFLRTQRRSVLVKTGKGDVYEVRTKNIKGPAPKEWIIEAENDLQMKKARLDEAQRKYDRLKDGVDSEQRAVLEARLAAAQAKLASLSVLAPFDGVVADMKAKLGSSIKAGETAVTVADFSQWLVKTTDLTEIDVVNLAEGQPVTIMLDALPGEELKGKILSIGQSYAQNQGDVVYEVTALLNDTHPAMRWGMTAAVRFENQD
jgi:multidrug efflux pump subunit AcrA (membrane-fusion protein)